MTFENVLLSDRSKLTPKESAAKLINFALLQDAKQRSRVLRNTRANVILPILLTGFPIYYVLKGLFHGCWTNLHPTNRLTLAFQHIGQSFRLVYRPEIFLRDQQAAFIQLEKENVRLAKTDTTAAAESVTSPLVLWN